MAVIQYKKSRFIFSQPAVSVFVSFFLIILLQIPDFTAQAQNSDTKGVASFYSNKLHGRKTASGEKYNKNKLTAAHRSLPFGTILKVTNLNNGKSVLVIVNDRGPYAKQRIIDLSYAAACKLNMVQDGIAHVVIEPTDTLIVEEPQSPLKKQPVDLQNENYYSPGLEPLILPKGYCLQVGSFALYENALARIDQLESYKTTSICIQYVKIHRKTFFRVLCTGFKSEATAKIKQQELSKLGLESFIIPEKK